jgi:hypothetical protein
VPIRRCTTAQEEALKDQRVVETTSKHSMILRPNMREDAYAIHPEPQEGNGGV